MRAVGLLEEPSLQNVFIVVFSWNSTCLVQIFQRKWKPQSELFYMLNEANQHFRRSFASCTIYFIELRHSNHIEREIVKQYQILCLVVF